MRLNGVIVQKDKRLQELIELVKSYKETENAAISGRAWCMKELKNYIDDTYDTVISSKEILRSINVEYSK